MKLKINIIATFLLVGGLMASCGKDEIKTEKESVKITVLEASVSSMEKEYHYSGKVISTDRTLLSTKVIGQIERIPKVGSKVRKGELIIRIKNKELTSKLAGAKAAYSQSKASLENTKKDYERISRLFEKGSSTQKELDDISTRIQVQEAQLVSASHAVEELKELISYSEIISPIDGFVSEKFANTSDMATPGRPLIALESLGNLELEVRVPEFEIGLFEVGKEISVEVKALGGQIMKAKIGQIVPSSEFSGAQYLVKASLPHSNLLKPGMFARINLSSGEDEKLIIPNHVIHKRGQLTGVYTVNQQGESMLRWIRLGKTYPEGTEILSGLEKGEQIISDFEGKPVAGVKVEIKTQN